MSNILASSSATENFAVAIRRLPPHGPKLGDALASYEPELEDSFKASGPRQYELPSSGLRLWENKAKGAVILQSLDGTKTTLKNASLTDNLDKDQSHITISQSSKSGTMVIETLFADGSALLEAEIFGKGGEHRSATVEAEPDGRMKAYGTFVHHDDKGTWGSPPCEVLPQGEGKYILEGDGGTYKIAAPVALEDFLLVSADPGEDQNGYRLCSR